MCASLSALSSARLLTAQSASHVVLLLVKKYPHYKIVNYDKVRRLAPSCA